MIYLKSDNIACRLVFCEGYRESCCFGRLDKVSGQWLVTNVTRLDICS